MTIIVLPRAVLLRAAAILRRAATLRAAPAGGYPARLDRAPGTRQRLSFA